MSNEQLKSAAGFQRRFSLLVMMMLGLLLAPEARPEVRSYTVGVDVNCPTGLGE